MLLTVVTCPDVRVEEELSEVELSPEWPFGSWYDGRAMELSPIVKEVVVVSESSSCETVFVAITYNYYSHYCMNLCFTLELILINADFFSNDCICMKKFLDAGIQDVSTSISIVHDLTEKHKFWENFSWRWWWWKWQTYISTRS